ncbi:signal transduction histidine kinase [Leucobacter komagatae]|uniref:histidine kinase n=1 Tax=Leucobacter komagatae TaxID=55969 RepID=A0A542Y7L5_9MICO|nr:ATP-binding protein [Leucobacter komagatae]TQL44066.1 signal transduction histidine kinase [Leucobacter komagatae]
MRSADGAQGRGQDRGRFRLTIRARITLSVALLIALGGGVLVVGLNLFMRYGPVWAIQSSPAMPADTLDLGVDSVAPTYPYGDAAEPALPSESLTELSLTVPVLEIRDVTDVFQTLLWSSIIALVVIVALGAVAAWALAGRVLSPLHDINAAARAATPGQLDRRVALRGPRDELTDLSDTLDDMLERLERAFRAQQLFAANASHELRTPLATQKAMLDVLLDGPEPTLAEYRLAAERLREVNARSIEMGEALLDLTRAQIGLAASGGALESLAVEPCEARELAEAALGHASERLAERGLTVDSDVAPHSVRVNPAMFTRLLDNLVGNAARHATAGSRVAIDWRVDGAESVLVVRNAAEPLPAETLDRLHQPFVRGGGRVRADSGSGLGLAIATAVAQAHGGSLAVSSAAQVAPAVSVASVVSATDPGTAEFCVEVRIPLEAPVATLAT